MDVLLPPQTPLYSAMQKERVWCLCCGQKDTSTMEVRPEYLKMHAIQTEDAESCLRSPYGLCYNNSDSFFVVHCSVARICDVMKGKKLFLHHWSHEETLGCCDIVSFQELLFIDKGRDEKRYEHEHHYGGKHLCITYAHNPLHFDVKLVPLHVSQIIFSTNNVVVTTICTVFCCLLWEPKWQGGFFKAFCIVIEMTISAI